jgi:hypothetical protein
VNHSLLRARLVNTGGELIAEGACSIDEQAGLVMLEPDWEPGLIHKERGEMTLQLESGRSLKVNDRPLVMRVRPPERTGRSNGHGPDNHSARTYYRLRIAREAQDVAAAGAPDEGPSSHRGWEAPAAR